MHNLTERGHPPASSNPASDHRSLVESATDAVFTIQTDGTFGSLNDRTVNIRLLRLPGIDVRRVRAEEWEVLRDTRLRALADAPDAFETTYAESLARPQFWWQDWARRSATGGDQAMFLAWERAAAVGIGGVFREDGRVYVISMWTDPGSRGRGVGRALLDAAVAFAGDVEIRLSVTETNAAARRLYERYGFAPTGHTEPLRSNPSLLVHELELRR